MRRRALQIGGLLALLAGTVAAGFVATTVFQQSVPVAPGITGCARLEANASKIDCLSDEFLEGAAEAASGLEGRARERAILRYVRRQERRAAADDRLAGTCHPAMHALGRVEGRRAAAQARVPEFPVAPSQLCTAGYVHGLAEGYMAEAETPDLRAVFPKLCHEPAARSGCAHGIGHALVRARSDADARQAATESVELCATLPEEAAGDCYDGVYMELAMRTRPEPLSVEEYTALCGSVRDVDRQLACWGYLGLSFTSNDVATDEMPRWCAKAPLPSQFICVEGYGRGLSVEGVARCGTTIDRASLQKRCIEGAVGLQVGSGHVEADEARTACRTLDDRGLVEYCLDAVTRYRSGRAKAEAEPV